MLAETRASSPLSNLWIIEILEWNGAGILELSMGAGTE